MSTVTYNVANCDFSYNDNPLCSLTISRKMACPDPSYCSNCDNISSINLTRNEKRIQNQISVHGSQLIGLRSAFTIAEDFLDLSVNDPVSGISRPSSMNWSSRYNLRNQSDRRVPHGMLFNNIPTRGNSVRSTITSNRPGGMSPGGNGVDVKHNSYARYLGKLKGKTMALGSTNGIAINPPEKTRYGVANTINNKSQRFTLVNTKNCLCDGR